MAIEMSVSEVVLSIGQEIVIDVVKGIYKDKTLASRIEKEFKKAVFASVKAVLPYEHDDKVVNAIAEDIFFFLTKKEIDKVNLVEIVENTLNQYGDYNKDSKLIAKGIAAELPMQIFKFKELNVLVNSKLAFELLDKHEKVLVELEVLKEHVILSRYDNQVVRELLMQLMDLSRDIVSHQWKMNDNNKFIPDKYKIYFYNKLFLEENLGDNQIAILKDVYVKPHFSILDFKSDSTKGNGDNIIQFIEDFVGVDKRKNKYVPYFDFHNKYITTLFIKGHPGSGKSSLFYYLAYMKSHESEFLTDYKMYFVKLIELYKENNNTLSEKNPLDDMLKHLNIQNEDFDNTVLVLDGLDEICAARDINIYEYCANLINSTFRFNNFRIIITTRLNYINIKNEDNKNVLNIQLNNWEIEDLQNWTKEYFEVHKERKDLLQIAHDNINYLSRTDNKEMLAILAVPLIFYMITAIGLRLCNLKSIGQLYDKVFEELYARNYNENNNSAIQKSGIIKAIPRKVSRQIAMEIAYKMYEENELLLKVNSIELGQAINNALNCGENVEVDSLHKREIEKLFPITFFYKEVYDVVEFAHKSIMEFFCAEKIYQDFVLSNQNIASFIFKNMVEIPISVEIMQFFSYFYDTRDKGINTYKKDIIIEFEKIIQGGDEWNRINKRAYGFEISKLVFKIFWIFIKDILKCKIEDVNQILSNKYMKTYLIGILNIRNSNNLQFINNDVYSWNFRDCVFKGYNFNYVDMRHADFSNTMFIECSFTNSDLQACIFSNVIFKEFADFSYSNLCHSKFENIDKVGKIYMKYTRVGDTVISNCNIKKWVFYNIIYMDKIKFINVTLTEEQFIMLQNEHTLFDDITILIKPSIITAEYIYEMKKVYRKNKENWDNLLEDYINDIIKKWEMKYIYGYANVKKYNLSYKNTMFKKYINERVQKI